MSGVKVPAEPRVVHKDRVIIKEREPVALSWARDGATFGMLIATAWALNTQMPPSGWLNAALAIVWFLWVLSQSVERSKAKTPDEARAWLDEHHPADFDTFTAKDNR